MSDFSYDDHVEKATFYFETVQFGKAINHLKQALVDTPQDENLDLERAREVSEMLQKHHPDSEKSKELHRLLSKFKKPFSEEQKQKYSNFSI